MAKFVVICYAATQNWQGQSLNYHNFTSARFIEIIPILVFSASLWILDFPSKADVLNNIRLE